MTIDAIDCVKKETGFVVGVDGFPISWAVALGKNTLVPLVPLAVADFI